MTYILAMSDRGNTVMGSRKTYRRSREMQSTPFGLVSNFRKQQLCLSSDLPGFQRFIASELLLIKVPDNSASSVPARPLTIDVNIDIHIEST